MVSRVLIVDDHPVVREGLKRILESTEEIQVAAEAGDFQEALEQVWHNRFDVVLLDYILPGGKGIEVLEAIKRDQPQLPVLMISMDPSDHLLLRILDSGGAGFLSKSSPPDALIDAIRTAYSGRIYITPEQGQFLAERRAQGNLLPHESLSNREYQVFVLIGEGKNTGEIASELNIGIKTIQTYLSRAREKMNMTRQAEIIRYVIENKLRVAPFEE